MATTWTWMRHPVTGGRQRFADAAVPAWRAEGWEPCDPPEPDNLAVGPDHPLRASTTEPPTETVDEPVGADLVPANTKSRRASAETREE